MTRPFEDTILSYLYPVLDTCGLFQYLESWDESSLKEELNRVLTQSEGTQGTILSLALHNTASAAVLFLLLRKGANPNIIYKVPFSENVEGFRMGTVLDEWYDEVQSVKCEKLGGNVLPNGRMQFSYEDPKAPFNIADRNVTLRAFGAKTINELNARSTAEVVVKENLPWSFGRVIGEFVSGRPNK